MTTDTSFPVSINPDGPENPKGGDQPGKVQNASASASATPAVFQTRPTEVCPAVPPDPSAGSNFTVDLRKLIRGLDAILLPSTDLPASGDEGKRMRAGTGDPRFTMVAAPGHLRFRLERHGVMVETTIDIDDPHEGPASEVAVILADPALFKLFAKSRLDDLEYKARRQGPGRAKVQFELDPQRPSLLVSFGSARIHLKVLCASVPAPIGSLAISGAIQHRCDPRALAEALRLASTFTLQESASERRAASRLNIISCGGGMARGGTATSFTVVTSSALAPYQFSVHRRDGRILAHLLQRSGTCSFSTTATKVGFGDTERIIEVIRAPIDFPDTADTMSQFDSAEAEHPAMLMDVVPAALIQSIVQEKDSDRHPLLTTMAIDTQSDGDIVLRARSADGRNEARAPVPVQVTPASGSPIHITVGVRHLLRAFGTARPSSLVSFRALKNCLSIALTDNDRVVQHVLAGSGDPPLVACRNEEGA